MPFPVVSGSGFFFVFPIYIGVTNGKGERDDHDATVNSCPGRRPASVHKDLAALQAQEGKGGPPCAALVAAINAEILAFYKGLLGIPTT